MLGELATNPLGFLFWILALVIAITIHEFSHAYAADRLGDPTPRLQGRLTLNPLAHLDPLGTLMLLIARFGWGKPVVFDPFNLRRPRRDAAIISFAGPLSNLIMATFCAVLLQILLQYRLAFLGNSFGIAVFVLMGILRPIIILDVVLAIFNLVPIHPLDGFKIVGGILPKEYASQWYELEPYGMIFLIFLIFPIFGGTSPISNIISPIINAIVTILLPSASFI